MIGGMRPIITIGPDCHCILSCSLRLTLRGRIVTSRAMAEDPDFSELSFEEALKRLEHIVARLESGDAALDEAIGLYAQGDRLRAQCEARLAAAQARIEKISVGADGRPAGATPFDAG